MHYHATTVHGTPGPKHLLALTGDELAVLIDALLGQEPPVYGTHVRAKLGERLNDIYTNLEPKNQKP